MFIKKLCILLSLLFGVIGLHANNYDLSDAKYTAMDTYKAEAFASNLIYSESNNTEGNIRYLIY